MGYGRSRHVSLRSARTKSQAGSISRLTCGLRLSPSNEGAAVTRNVFFGFKDTLKELRAGVRGRGRRELLPRRSFKARSPRYASSHRTAPIRKVDWLVRLPRP